MCALGRFGLRSLWCGEDGRRHLSAVIDRYGRCILGWAVTARADTDCSGAPPHAPQLVRPWVLRAASPGDIGLGLKPPVVRASLRGTPDLDCEL